jgi:spore germination cell wall hydrolase CwlJ-like protein
MNFKSIIFSILIISSPAFAKNAGLSCLAEAVYVEARGESTKGQALVADVIINRTKAKGFPSTYCGVIAQPGQFPWYNKDYKFRHNTEWFQHFRHILKTRDPNPNILYFNNKPFKHGKKGFKLGNHYFYEQYQRHR